MNPEDTLVAQIAMSHPDLKVALADHKRTYGEILHTLFLSDVARWAAERYLASDPVVVSDLLALLESLYESGPQDYRELIGVGFVENMPSTGAPAAGMRQMLGPRLAEEFRRLNW